MDNTKAHEKIFSQKFKFWATYKFCHCCNFDWTSCLAGIAQEKKELHRKNATYLRQEKQVKRNARVTTSERSYYFWAPKFENKDTIIIPYHTRFYFYHQEKQLICEIVLFTWITRE